MSAPSARRAHRALLATLAGLTLFSCQPREPGPATVAPATPIVLISIDTLRSDHLPAYGYDGVDTPAIDRLRAAGVLFEHAYSPAPLTLPAHASLFTGALPPRHRVRDNIGYTLDGSLPTLAERLRDLGYRTGAAVSAFVLRHQTGIGRGFERFDDELSWSGFAVMADVQRSGLDTVAAMRGWLEEVSAEPFFLFVHLYEPHAPYVPPEPFATATALAYDGEIAAADHAVGALLAQLDELDLFDRSILLLTSDHGEGLGDHGEAEHGVLLYRESLQVPLILKLPFAASAGAIVETPVQLGDVPVTLLAQLGAPVPETMTGDSLVDLIGREAPARALYSETYYPRLRLGWSELRSLIEGRYHYIDGPDPELYDLRADPRERRSLLPGERRRARASRARLAELEATPAEPLESDDEVRRALATLGYLTDRAATPDAGPLPDPKSRIGTLETLDLGLESFRRGELTAAVPRLRQSLQENPGMIVAWEFLGRAHLHLGQPEEAFTSLSKAFELSSGAAHLAEHLARAAVATGRLEEAYAYLELALERRPDDPALRMTHARILLQLGRFGEALAVADAVRRGHPESADAVYLSGTVKIGLGRLDEAEADLRRALALSPRHAAAMSDLAVLLLSTGRSAEARPLVEALLEIQPGNPVALRLLRDLPAGAAPE